MAKIDIAASFNSYRLNSLNSFIELTWAKTIAGVFAEAHNEQPITIVDTVQLEDVPVPGSQARGKVGLPTELQTVDDTSGMRNKYASLLCSSK